ncbi:MAG: AzlD domain-containing protein [Planctomycetaceae bacterium]|nr:AzlD domain-containing protein [Planctomycetaceae bacterium]
MPSETATWMGIGVLALATYLTRIAGYLLGTRIREGSRTYRIIQTLPGCAISAVLAPSLINGSFLETSAICSAAVFFYFTGRILSALSVGLLISILGTHWLLG